MPWIFLSLAIACEVTGTVALRFSEGFTKVVPSAVVLVGYGAAFYLLSLALTGGMHLGVAYGVWAAAGVALLAVIGAVFLGESMTWIQITGIGLVIAGVMALEMGAAH